MLYQRDDVSLEGRICYLSSSFRRLQRRDCERGTGLLTLLVVAKSDAAYFLAADCWGI